MRALQTISVFLVTLFTLIVSCKKSNFNDVENDSQLNKNPLVRLKEGNERFITGKQKHLHQDMASVHATSKEQHPFAIIITCSDSRVDPDVIFDQGIGDLFIIKNAGNILSDVDLGSVEYAVEHLNTKLIVVMGHTDCGAIKAFVNRDFQSIKNDHTEHIKVILDSIALEKEIMALNKMDSDYYNLCINANIDHVAHVLEKNEVVKNNRAKVIKMLYDTQKGSVKVIDSL